MQGALVMGMKYLEFSGEGNALNSSLTRGFRPCSKLYFVHMMQVRCENLITSLCNIVLISHMKIQLNYFVYMKAWVHLGSFFLVCFLIILYGIL
jgi:hypothetical protein